MVSYEHFQGEQDPLPQVHPLICQGAAKRGNITENNTTMMSHVLSDDTWSLCRHWNQDLNIPRVMSTQRWGSLITAATIPNI